jgi:pimeloyl-ACP methyl ester carboxylesterase
MSAPAPKRSGYVTVAGTDVYYEVHGDGPPVLMVHGAFGATRQFGGLLPAVARGRSAVLVDLQGHGRTADRPERFSYERFADDCAAVLEHLGTGPVAALGYSMGGGTVQQLAFRHPGLVSKLAVISAPFRSSGWLPDVMANFRNTGSHQWPAVKESSLYEDHAAVAPRPDDFAVLLDKLGWLLGGHEYDWTEPVRALTVPVLIALGDGDSLSPGHAAEMFALLGGGLRDGGLGGEGLSRARLAVLPRTTHYDILGSPLFERVLVDFLEG